MANLKSGISLSEGETLVMELEAELSAVVSNPIIGFILPIIRPVIQLIDMVLCHRKKGFLVVTNKRVVEVQDEIICCITIGRQVKYVLPSSIKEVGYDKKATFFGLFCPAYHLYYQSFTNTKRILMKGASEDDALKAANAFYNAIAIANK